MGVSFVLRAAMAPLLAKSSRPRTGSRTLRLSEARIWRFLGCRRRGRLLVVRRRGDETWHRAATAAPVGCMEVMAATPCWPDPRILVPDLMVSGVLCSKHRWSSRIEAMKHFAASASCKELKQRGVLASSLFIGDRQWPGKVQLSCKGFSHRGCADLHELCVVVTRGNLLPSGKIDARSWWSCFVLLSSVSNVCVNFCADHFDLSVLAHRGMALVLLCELFELRDEICATWWPQRWQAVCVCGHNMSEGEAQAPGENLAIRWLR